MNNRITKKSYYDDSRGATAVIVAVLLIVIIGVGALAVDLGFGYVQRSRLQNAVDAAALASARVLYQNEGKKIDRTRAESEALEVAKLNVNDAQYVVEIGHWAFGLGSLNKGFYINPNNTPIELADYSEVQLDEMQSHINAVRVKATSQSPTFLSRIWGHTGINIRTHAVAYLGYSGTLDNFEVDIPLLMCAEALKWDEDNVTCGIGRLIHSGGPSNQSNFNTGAWTTYVQGDTCSSAWNAGENNSVKPGMQYILQDIDYDLNDCKAGNPTPILYGEGVSAGGGQAADPAFNALGECARFPAFIDGNTPARTKPWNITVLVVQCTEEADPLNKPGKGNEGQANNPHGCLPVVGAVNMDIVLMTSDPDDYEGVPSVMGDFNADGETGYERWQAFVDAMGLEVLNQESKEFEPAYDHYYHKTIYAKPSCEKVEGRGGSGGQNFGIMAKIPVLVN